MINNIKREYNKKNSLYFLILSINIVDSIE